MDVRATWTPSVSTDVVVQRLTWYVNDEVLREVNLPPSGSSRLLSEDGGIPVEGDNIEVSIVANDGHSDSEIRMANIEIPLDPPAPVTDLGLEIL